MKNALKDLQRKTEGASSENRKLEVLTDAYEQAMEIINEQRPGVRRLARDI